ncbi:MAG: recombination protein O N-terminal domain-containing protein [Novosphingobium sp.]
MHIRASAIVCATRPHGETAVIARLLTQDEGMVAAYVAGGRGRHLRPVLVPGNVVSAELRSRSDTQLPFASVELQTSRGQWMGEPLAALAIQWATALTATTLPERQAYPLLYDALAALLDAICLAPSARGWTPALLSYELLLLRELGYGEDADRLEPGDWTATMTSFDRIGTQLERYLLAERRGNVMAARAMLRERLGKIGE